LRRLENETLTSRNYKKSLYVADESGFTPFTYKPPKPSLEQIGKQLAVETMLEMILFWN